MFKKLFLMSFIIFSFIGVFYPIKKENTKLFRYCYCFEKIFVRNSIQKRKNVSEKVNSISKEIAKFGVNKTQGALANKMIYQYKNSKNSLIIELVPNESYCLVAYWVEMLKPGTFEAVLDEKSKKVINEFKFLKDEVDLFINDINSEYQFIKKEFDSFF